MIVCVDYSKLRSLYPSLTLNAVGEPLKYQKIRDLEGLRCFLKNTNEHKLQWQ